MSAEVKKVLVLALGGEGGGTLTQWVVEASLALGWPVQSTSIPGVAQRTGATSYYIECLPRALAEGERPPPMCLAPLAGDLHLIVSSELLETARAVERGMSSPALTRVISSTARALTTDERTHMADGRWEAEHLSATVGGASQRLDVFDMAEAARNAGTVVSAVMFGALAASGVLPLPRDLCERIVAGDGGKRGAASVAGLAAGWAAIEGAQRAHSTPGAGTAAVPRGPQADKRALTLEQLLELGQARLRDHQDAAYAADYSARIARIAAADDATQAASRTAARYLALWMAYEDVIRVADLKSRRSRFERIRAEHRARPDEPMVVRDYLKPGVDEVAAILPPALAIRLQQWAARRGVHAFGEGIALHTSSVTGLLALRLLASLRFLRRRSSRFLQQQALVARWCQALHSALAHDTRPGKPLACAVAELPRLIKGYSDTFERGHANFVRILQTLVEPALARGDDAPALAQRVATALQAALAAPDGNALFDALQLPRPAPREQPIRFVKPSIQRRQT
jgi:indolepyruvate ferredoxin oxidoreductase beta subunit